MYETFFEMKATPFINTIPTDALFVSNALEETLGRLSYAANKNMFAVVSADVGVGKTTGIRKFVASLSKETFTVLYLADSKLTPRWFYKGLLDQLGIESKFYRGDAKRQLHKQLEIIRDVHHKTVVTIVDEAHLLDRETFEEIRFLLNFKMDSVNPMSLILVGQTELWDKLKLQVYKAIRQRIDIKCELYPYDRAETERYIKSHLLYSGAGVDIFSDAAIDEIFNYSVGASRAINKVCTHALMSAAQKSKKIIDDHLIKTVVDCEMV